MADAITRSFTFEGYRGLAIRYSDGQTWVQWATLSCWMDSLSPELQAKINSLF